MFEFIHKFQKNNIFSFIKKIKNFLKIKFVLKTSMKKKKNEKMKK